VHIQ
jgi:uncharacterized protein